MALKKGTVGRIYRGAVSLTILLSVAQQFPVIRETAYDGIKIALYVLFAVYAFVGVFGLNHKKVPRIGAVFAAVVAVWLLECACLSLLGLRVVPGDIVELLIPLGFLVVGFTSRFSDKGRNALLTVYAGLSIVMGLALAFYYGGGLAITKHYIMKIANKNQTGPMVIMGAIIMLHVIISRRPDWKRKLSARLAAGGMLCLAMVVSLALRNRAGLAAFIVVAAFMALWAFGRRISPAKAAAVSFLAVFTVVLIQAGMTARLIKPFYDSFTLSYDVRDLDQLTAGRVRTYLEAASLVKRYPVLGLMNTNEYISKTPHNYALNKVVSYGFLGALPLLILYAALIVFLIRELAAARRKGVEADLSIYLLMCGLIISLVEYSYPYTPGCSLIMVWFMVGQYLQKKAAGPETAGPRTSFGRFGLPDELRKCLSGEAGGHVKGRDLEQETDGQEGRQAGQTDQP